MALLGGLHLPSLQSRSHDISSICPSQKWSSSGVRSISSNETPKQIFFFGLRFLENTNNSRDNLLVIKFRDIAKPASTEAIDQRERFSSRNKATQADLMELLG